MSKEAVESKSSEEVKYCSKSLSMALYPCHVEYIYALHPSLIYILVTCSIPIIIN